MSWCISLRGRRSSISGEPFVLDAALRAPAGITILAGASGSGKSSFALGTLGVLELEQERIQLGDRVLCAARSRVPPQQRGLACVLQDAPLFPHLTVAQNIALSPRSASSDEQTQDWLKRTDTFELRDMFPTSLSGGQRQRVAFARAMASKPSGLILDEPFSALDAAQRRKMGDLLQQHCRDQQLSALLITHQLADAIRWGDHLAIMAGGSIVEQGEPLALLRAPQHRATASFSGLENLLEATVTSAEQEGLVEVLADGATLRIASDCKPPVGATVWVGFRAEEILLAKERPSQTSARNLFAGTLVAIHPTPFGFQANIEGELPVGASITQSALNDLGLDVGDQVWCLLKASAIRILT